MGQRTYLFITDEFFIKITGKKQKEDNTATKCQMSSSKSSYFFTLGVVPRSVMESLCLKL